jgi:hypothetical protein
MLAGINLVAAVPLILMLEARDAQYLREREENAALAARGAATRKTALAEESPTKTDAAQEEETVSFNPCAMWVHYPVQVEVLRFSNLPAFVLTGWRVDCPAKWTISGLMHVDVERARTAETATAERRVDVSLCILIIFQWFFVGAFPLAQEQKWWSEPGTVITACVVVATCLALIPAVNGVARVPALLAGLAWFWWFGLLALRTVQFGWRRILGKNPS